MLCFAALPACASAGVRVMSVIWGGLVADCWFASRPFNSPVVTAASSDSHTLISSHSSFLSYL